MSLGLNLSVWPSFVSTFLQPIGKKVLIGFTADRHYTRKYGAAVYPVGFGLSFTTFSYEWTAPTRDSVAIVDLAVGTAAGCFDCSALQFGVKVTNTSRVSGDTVVLGLITQTINGAGNSTALRSLSDFGRLKFAAGASARRLTLCMHQWCKQAI